MEQITPGPWTYHAVRRGTLGDEDSMRDDGYGIRAAEPAKFGGTDVCHVDDGSGTHESANLANAHAIALVPDLIAALTQVEDLGITEPYCGLQDKPDVWAAVQSVMGRLRNE